MAASFAFARAVEAALGAEVPARAQVLRGVMAELERIANHLGDIGAICNDAAFALLHAHTGILRERVLAASERAFGHRLMMDLIVPGGEPHDQSVRFGRGSALYAGVLRGDTLALNILRSAPYSPSTLMQILVSRPAIDQPYVSARPAEARDRVFVGNNDAITGPYRGSVEHSPDAHTAPPPAGFAQSVLDPRLPFIRELPPIR